MSASQALAAARRRRVNSPAISKPNQSSNSKLKDVPAPKAVDLKAENQEDLSASQSSFVPKEVPTAKNPSQLLVQHNVRLYNLENGLSHSMSLLDSNIDILSTGYNSLSNDVKENNDSLMRKITDLESMVKLLSAKLEAVEKQEAVGSESNQSSNDSMDDDESEVTIHFASE